MSRLFLAYLFVLLCLSGCARMDVIPLKHDGTVDATKQEGLRYYLPKPYLLVAEAPTEKKLNQQSDGDHSYAAGDDGKVDDKAKGGSASGSPSSASDTSFSLVTDNYIIKLVYLPDYSHPMAIHRPVWAIFGTTDTTVSLQNGWMLTSFGGKDDSKTAETISSVASLVGALAGATKTAASGGTTKAQSIHLESIEQYNQCIKNAKNKEEKTECGNKTNQNNKDGLPNVLSPGLYEFEYNETDGKLTGLKPVVHFYEGNP